MNTKTPVMLLNEFMVKIGDTLRFEFLEKTDPDTFKCETNVQNIRYIGTGRTKKDAKQDAAKKALDKLHSEGNYFLSPGDNVTIPMKPKNSDQCLNVTKLQDFCTAYGLLEPVYYCTGDTGPAHSKLFTMKCCVGSVEHTETATTKKLAKQLAAGKCLDYYKENVPKRVKDIDESLDEMDKLNDIALNKYTTLESIWRPNLGLQITDYPYALVRSTEAEKRNTVISLLRDENLNMSPINLIEDVLNSMQMEYDWSTMEGKDDHTIIFLNVPQANPPICVFGFDSDEALAKVKAAKEALSFFKIMLTVSPKTD